MQDEEEEEEGNTSTFGRLFRAQSPNLYIIYKTISQPGPPSARHESHHVLRIVMTRIHVEYTHTKQHRTPQTLQLAPVTHTTPHPPPEVLHKVSAEGLTRVGARGGGGRGAGEGSRRWRWWRRSSKTRARILPGADIRDEGAGAHRFRKPPHPQVLHRRVRAHELQQRSHCAPRPLPPAWSREQRSCRRTR